jgi:hypothetical protein
MQGKGAETQKTLGELMSEQPGGEKQDPQTTGSTTIRRALFGFVAILLLLGLSWVFVPFVRC